MSIKIENTINVNDHFKVTCSSCGRNLSYDRSDIRYHKRFPNGFIYCPGCKAPVAHSEENLVKTGEQIRSEQIANEKLLREKEQRNAEIKREREIRERNNPDLIKKSIKDLKSTRSLFIKIGVPVLVIGVLIVIACSILSIIYYNELQKELHPIIALGCFLGIGGIVLLVFAGIFNGKIKNREYQLRKIEENEKNGN